jgi:hypothetical protein
MIAPFERALLPGAGGGGAEPEAAGEEGGGGPGGARESVAVDRVVDVTVRVILVALSVRVMTIGGIGTGIARSVTVCCKVSTGGRGGEEEDDDEPVAAVVHGVVVVVVGPKTGVVAGGTSRLV